MLKYKVNDEVVVTAGKDKGKKGNIVKVYPKKSKVLVEGVNLYKKHVKGSQQENQKGGIYDIPRPLHFSKVALIDPKTNKPTRVGFKLVKGKKVRIAKKSGVSIDK